MSRIDDVSVDDRFTLEKTPTRPQLFRYSAITWNPHRIHYDPEHAREEGHPDVLVQAHLHGAVVQQLLLDEFGPEGRLVELSWRNVGRAVPDEMLRAVAEVTAVDTTDGRVEFDVRTENEETRCADGDAAIVFPD